MNEIGLAPWQCARVGISSSDEDARGLGLAWAILYLGDTPADIALIPNHDTPSAAAITTRADLLIVSGPRSAASDRLAQGFAGIVAYVPAGWAPRKGPIVAATGHDRESDAELDTAIELARRDDVPLVLTHVWGMPGIGIVDMPPDPFLIGSIPDGQAKALTELADRLRARSPGLEIQTEVRQSTHVGSELAQVADQLGASAIVIARPARHRGNASIGSVATRVLGHATCPVIVIPGANRRDLRP